MISPPGPGRLRKVFNDKVSVSLVTGRCSMISPPGPMRLRKVFDDKPTRAAQEGVQ